MSVQLDLLCPRSLPEERWVSLRADSGRAIATDAPCPACGVTHPPPDGERPLTAEDGLLGCLACGHAELFTQKRFPRAAGLGIVVLAAILAPFTYYLSLLVAAAVDALLYWLAPNVVVCYVCRARHGGFHPSPAHPAFDREIDERLKFGERAVMGKPMREGGTAGAPEPEH